MLSEKSFVMDEVSFTSHFYEDDSLTASVFGKKELSELDKISDEEKRREEEKEFLSSVYKLPPERIFFIRQCHGIEFIKIEEGDIERNKGLYFAKADAMYTQTPRVLLCIRTADCLPIFFTLSGKINKSSGKSEKEKVKSPVNDRIDSSLLYAGIIHAGWRGLAGGIINNTLESLMDSHADFTKFITGPAIGGESYTVGPETAEKFEFKERIGSDRFLLDLRKNALHQIKSYNRIRQIDFIKNLSGCTYQENELYYSHRRGDSGRNLNVIMIK